MRVLRWVVSLIAIVAIATFTRDFASTASAESATVRGLRWIVSLIGIVVIATSFLPLLPVDWWWVRIGDYPRVQLLIVSIIAASMIAPFWRQPMSRVLIGLLAVGVMIQLYWIFPYLPIASRTVEDARSENPASRVKILTANVLQKNEDAAPILKLIADEQPDIVVLCEVNARWIADLKPLEEQFKFHLTHPLENTYGIALYSNLEVIDATVRGMVKEDIPSIDAQIRLPSGQPVHLFAVHPNPPRPGEDTTKRDAELVLVGREIRQDETAIVLGDMNDVGWSRTTNLFREVSRLLDPRRGRGMFPTFDATSRIWRYPLDYLFHSEDFRVAQLRVLSDIGSDHFPLLVELSHEPDARDTQEAPDLDPDDVEDADKAVQAVSKNDDV